MVDGYDRSFTIDDPNERKNREDEPRYRELMHYMTDSCDHPRDRDGQGQRIMLLPTTTGEGHEFFYTRHRSGGNSQLGESTV